MNDEISQVKERYKKRDHFSSAMYDPLVPSVSKARQEKELALIRWINCAGLAPVNDKSVLEVGCGSGSNLLQLLTLGFQPENLFGNELLEDRVASARHLLPNATQIFEGDASSLDLAGNKFDVVLQSTVFTSILDNTFQQKLADRMWSLVKPGGGVLWFDFIYDNPKNPDVRGVPLKRVRELFPDGEFTVWRVTLAPPISRLVTKIHPALYNILNLLPFLRTHILCWITKKNISRCYSVPVIREATMADISAIAHIHKMQFSDHLLGQLTLSLIEKFYSYFLEKCILIVSCGDEGVNGFLLGGHKSEIKKIKNKFISDNRVHLIIHTIFHFRTLYSLLLRRKDLLEEGLISNITQSDTRLLSIAVSENAIGTGVAKKLIQHFEGIISPYTEYGLSVKKTNKRAIKFYLKNGYVLESESNQIFYFVKTKFDVIDLNRCKLQ